MAKMPRFTGAVLPFKRDLLNRLLTRKILSKLEFHINLQFRKTGLVRWFRLAF
jgi:hypothetical protein